MPKFSYRAKNREGKTINGEITAESKARAKNMLANKGLRPLKVVAVAAGEDNDDMRTGISRFIYKDKQGNIQIQLGEELPTTKELALFTKQFSLMIENGIPMLQALQLLREQQKKATFSEIIGKIYHSIEQGSNLSDALEPYPRVFDSLYVAMTRAGEASGRLDIILKQLVKYIEKAAKLKGQIKSALAYPSIIVVVSIGVIAVLLVFVVPSFAQQFADSGNELPGLTQMVIDMSDALVNNWDAILLVFIACVLGLRYWYNTDKGRMIFDEYILKAPVLGDVMTKIAIGRFCSTMSTMLNSGVSILEALEICAASSGNAKIEQFVLHVKEEISKGQNFSDPLQESPLFPKMVSSMVAVGESTGTLDETLSKVTDIYEDEVDNAITAMMSMIEPAMIVIIGGIVGFILIAMYLPIFDMANNVG
ncbi:type II secretion system F family protein [Pseudobacteriovorax antillogorgiicola]|uniref:Type IV pilus assembly protein PilC n=1 Tax=Pseudobacteriovorax antillogorgiicola TaxID=1513793 RepID=A0A1Y6B5S2_9BACT|nr:type II secretion system F family protein [Pseudobacteriovorax antillogorgiicola]TCS59339.1 type IV pilus assembly protein PilC [Pseudobacteriovorax antillogorgiicola]SME89193.1 type IV pilus assembly protein PilC [Pseudobacteriovorax antillogorgiicola]